MTNFSLSKKQIISLLILLALVLILPLALFLSRQRQEVRKKAAGTGVLQLSLNPGTTTDKHPGDLINYTVKLANTTADPVQIRVVGVEFAVSPNLSDLEVSQFNCGSALNGKAFGDINAGRIRLVCYKTPGTPNDPLTIPAVGQPGSTIDVGSFQIALKNTATGSYTISSKVEASGRNNIPADVGQTDLSNEGAEATITVAGAPTTPVTTSTPTPIATLTLTPTPTTGAVTSPTPTTEPVATVTPVATATPADSCPDGDKGNLTCDADPNDPNKGIINMLDLTYLLGHWNDWIETPIPIPTPADRRHSPDIAPPDNLDQKVNMLDLTRLLGHWYDPVPTPSP